MLKRFPASSSRTAMYSADQLSADCSRMARCTTPMPTAHTDLALCLPRPCLPFLPPGRQVVRRLAKDLRTRPKARPNAMLGGGTERSQCGRESWERQKKCPTPYLSSYSIHSRAEPTPLVVGRGLKRGSGWRSLLNETACRTDVGEHCHDDEARRWALTPLLGICSRQYGYPPLGHVGHGRDVGSDARVLPWSANEDIDRIHDRGSAPTKMVSPKGGLAGCTH
jgi:hypothetical protein